MATLDELMQIKGVVAACEFTVAGELMDFRSSMNMPRDQAGMTAQFCSTVSIMFNTLAKAYSHMYSNKAPDGAPDREPWSPGWGQAPDGVTYEKVCQEGEDIRSRSGPLRVSVDYPVSHLYVLEGTG